MTTEANFHIIIIIAITQKTVTKDTLRQKCHWAHNASRRLLMNLDKLTIRSLIIFWVRWLSKRAELDFHWNGIFSPLLIRWSDSALRWLKFLICLEFAQTSLLTDIKMGFSYLRRDWKIWRTLIETVISTESRFVLK